LTLTNYKAWEDAPYCKNHYPVGGFGDGSNFQVKPNVDKDAMILKDQLNAPKVK